MREELLVVPPDTALPPVNATELKVIFNRLRVDAVLQHPAFVVIGAQTQLLLLISNHSPVVQAKASICCYVFASFQRGLESLPRDFVLSFRRSRSAEFLFSLSRSSVK